VAGREEGACRVHQQRQRGNFHREAEERREGRGARWRRGGFQRGAGGVVYGCSGALGSVGRTARSARQEKKTGGVIDMDKGKL